MKIAFFVLVAITACGGKKAQPTEPAAPTKSDGAGTSPEGPAPAATSDDVSPVSPKAEPIAAPTPATPQCEAKANPPGCPATEPNINARCKKNGLECTYGTSCCPPLYVCNKLKFEARFQSCPK